VGDANWPTRWANCLAGCSNSKRQHGPKTADELMLAVANAARTVAWIGDEAWDRVRSSFSSDPSLLGWRSRQRAPGLLVRDGQVDLEPDVDPTGRHDLVFAAAGLAVRKQARLGRDTLGRLAARAPLPPPVWPEELRHRFVGLLGGVREAVRELASLALLGIWERYMPACGVAL